MYRWNIETRVIDSDAQPPVAIHVIQYKDIRRPNNLWNYYCLKSDADKVARVCMMAKE